MAAIQVTITRLKIKKLSKQLRKFINIVLLFQETTAVFELAEWYILVQLGFLQKSKKSVQLFPEQIMSQKLNLSVLLAVTKPRRGLTAGQIEIRDHQQIQTGLQKGLMRIM